MAGPFITSVFPLELRQPSAAHAQSVLSGLSHQTALEAITFPEIEFQDCSARVDIEYILRLATGKQQATRPQQDRTQYSRDTNVKHGKRKAEDAALDVKSDKDVKRTQVDGAQQRSVHTVCRFAVVARDQQNAVKGRRLDELATEHGSVCLLPSTTLGPSRNVVAGQHGDPGSLLHSLLQLTDSSAKVVAELPIVNTDKIDLARSPQYFTNGLWLPSAMSLARPQSSAAKVGEEGHVRLNSSLHLVHRPSAFALDAFAEAFVLELRIEIVFNLTAATIGSSLLSTPDLIHLHRVVRFAYCDDEDEQSIRSSQGLTASDIYTYMQSTTLSPLASLQPRHLNANLYPFQRSTLHFLLGREGKTVTPKDESGEASIKDLADGIMSSKGVHKVGLWWKRLADDLYFSPVLGQFTNDVAQTRAYNVKGGILAEEMGLGKTVEVFGLVLLNPDEKRSALIPYQDEALDVTVAPTKTTLIVAPEVLRQQWLEEAALHAPDLRVFSYMGYRDARKQIPDDKTWFDFARQFDVMVVSYDTLRQEVNVARKASTRSMRFERKYERPRSLLIQLNFHRVVMDEVQLVGHSSAAETVAMIPRVYSLAVSGTPIKQLTDLKSLFEFLRLPGPLHSTAHWNRLHSSPEMIPSIASALGLLASRHTKEQVQSQMVLPQQTRSLVPVQFTAIEAAFYRDINQTSRRTLQIDEFGDLSRAELLRAYQLRFGEDASMLRSIVITLRQACTHPQIANRGARGNLLTTSQTIRSMDEVLTIMVEGSKAEHASALHSLYQGRIDRAVLLLQDKTDDGRHAMALAILRAARPEIETRVEEIKRDLERAKRVGPLYSFSKDESAELGDLDRMEATPPPPDIDNALMTQAERERENEKTEKRALRRRHYNAVQARLRVLLEQLHRCHHFEGNVLFQMGEKEKEKNAKTSGDQSVAEDESGILNTDNTSAATSVEADDVDMSDGVVVTGTEATRLKEEEDVAYKLAEDIRQELLRFSRTIVDSELRHMQKVAADFAIQELSPAVDFGNGGLRSRSQFETLGMLMEKLDGQSRLLFRWRTEIIERLTKPVNRNVSDEDENDDQYQENLDAQAEAEALLEMYRVLLAEREFMLTGVKLAGTLGRPQLYTQLNREVPHYERIAKRLELLHPQQSDGSLASGLAKDDYLPSPQELDVMKQQLDHFRKMEDDKREVAISAESKLRDTKRAARMLAHEAGEARRTVQRHDADEEKVEDDPKPFEEVRKFLRELSHKVDGHEEAYLAREGINQIRRLIVGQKPMIDKLKRESTHFSQTWNARAAYFKQMQELSDQVSDIQVEGAGGIAKRITELKDEEQTLRRRIDANEGRMRYLHAIEEETDTSADDAKTTPRTCPICTEPMTRAVVLDVCGHTTCATCFSRWTKARRTCPICRVDVTARSVYRVTYGVKGKERRHVELPEAKKRRTQLGYYNLIDDTLRDSISQMHIYSAFGSKLDLLMRHLLYIEGSPRRQKSLIFTAFSRGITLVGDALRLNGINFVALESGGARGAKVVDRFKNDEDVNVLLLHSEAQSSGLNLVCAQNIFLLEPLVNHSIELQAIGRVHRIGQVNPTNVYCYQVNDTVEESIVHLARGRSQSLFTHDKCVSNTLRDAAEMTAKTAAGRAKAGTRQGEFVADVADLIDCLVDADDEEGGPAAEDQRQSTSGEGSRAKSRSNGSALHTNTGDDIQDEQARMRTERLRAIEKRQALSSIGAETSHYAL